METQSGQLLLLDVRAFASGFRLFSIREQNKTFLNLFRNTIGWIDYDRFKQITYFDSEPLCEIERRFAQMKESYWSVIHNGNSVVYDGNEKASFVFECMCNEVNRFSSVIDRVAHINRILVTNRLVMLRFPLVQACTSLTPSFLLDYEYHSPKTSTAMDSLLKSSQNIDVLAFIKGLLLDYPIEKAFLFGSFAKGTAIAESDVDLGLFFQKGFSEDEKQALIGGIKSRIEDGIGRRGDIIEVFDCSERGLFQTIGVHKEVPLL